MDETPHCSKNPPLRAPLKTRRKKKKARKPRRAEILRSLKIKRAKRFLSDIRAGKIIPRCVTRTVEMSSSKQIGDESSKLLFVLALDLVPNPARTKTQGPKISIKKLDPTIEAETQTRTKEGIIGICRQRFGYLEANVECYLDTQVLPELPLLPLPVPPKSESSVVVSSDECPTPTIPRTTNHLKAQSGENRRPSLWRSVFRPWSNGQNQNGRVFGQLDAESMSQVVKSREAVGENGNGGMSPPQRKGFYERWLSFVRSRTFSTSTRRTFSPAVSTPTIVNLTSLPTTDERDESGELEVSLSSGVADLDGSSSEDDEIDVLN